MGFDIPASLFWRLLESANPSIHHHLGRNPWMPRVEGLATGFAYKFRSSVVALVWIDRARAASIMSIRWILIVARKHQLHFVCVGKAGVASIMSISSTLFARVRPGRPAS